MVAYDVIATKGFEGLRIREVAARAGVNSATLHYYYPTKEALVRAVVEHLVDQTRTLAIVDSERGGTALERFRREFTNLELRIRAAPQVYVVLQEMQQRALRDPGIRALLQETSVGWLVHITRILEDGVREGVVRPDLDIGEAVSIWIALIKGVVTQDLSGLDRFDFTRLGAFWERWIENPAMNLTATPDANRDAQ
jgi:AcrR family transcriptional regulator